MPCRAILTDDVCCSNLARPGRFLLDQVSGVIEIRTAHGLYESGQYGTITFGRSPYCTIKLDRRRPDPSLSRITGAFRRELDRWQLENLSGRLDLVVKLAGLRSVLEPGGWPLPLPAGSRGTVAIQTTRGYDFEFAVAPDRSAVRSQPGLLEEPMEGTRTSDLAAELGLNEIELVMLAALCEPRLRDPSVGPWSVPPTKVICARLDISPRKAEDIVDSLAWKFRLVLDGLIGENESRATNRRHRLADFAFRTRCVSVSDLGRLPAPPTA